MFHVLRTNHVYEVLFVFSCLCPLKTEQMHSDAVEAKALREPGARVPVNAYRVATRALMYGSALSIGCTSAGVLAVGYFMGVKNVSAEGVKCKELLL